MNKQFFSVYSSSVSENFTVSDETLATCGPNYCPAQIVADDTKEEDSSENDNFEAASDLSNTYKIAGIYLALSFSAAVILAIFLDPLTKFGEEERRDEKPKLSGKQLLVATFHHMKKKKQLLIIPLTFWSGIEQGFFGADFTAVSQSISMIYLLSIY